MAYTQKEWIASEVIGHDDLNNMEQGIADAHSDISEISETLSNKADSSNVAELVYDEAVAQGYTGESADAMFATLVTLLTLIDTEEVSY